MTDKETLSELIAQSKQGNRSAMERLLRDSYGPVYWRCRRLMNDPQLGEERTRCVLNALAKKIDRIKNPDHLHRWLGRTAAKRCMEKRSASDLQEYTPDTTDFSFPGKELSIGETARVAGILADSLPEELRICLILSLCCSVPTGDIAQMTGIPEETVTANIAEAEQGIQAQMQLYQEQGVVFSGSLRVSDLLQNAMVLEEDPAAAAAMVRQVFPPVPKASVPKAKVSGRPVPIVRILLCVAAAVLLLLLLVIWGVLQKRTQLPTEATAATTAAAETPASTDATTRPTAPSTETSATETTEKTTEETTEEVTEETSRPTEPETTPKKQTPTSSGSVPQTTPTTGTPTTPTTGTPTTPATESSSPTDPPGYNPGQGEDGHTHVLFTRPTGDKATCTRAATIYRICSICQQGIIIDDPDNPALGHDYQVNLVIAPTTTSQGYTNYRCTRCGDSYDADYVDPLPAPSTEPPESIPPESVPQEEPEESETP